MAVGAGEGCPPVVTLRFGVTGSRRRSWSQSASRIRQANAMVIQHISRPVQRARISITEYGANTWVEPVY